MMKKFLAFTLALLLLLSLAACGGTQPPAATPALDAPAYESYQEPPTSPPDLALTVLRVGMECGYAPFNWTQVDDSNGAVPLADGTFAGGYDVEIAKRVAEVLSLELEVQKVDWEGLPPSLTSDRIDAIIAGMTDTEDRRLTLSFSNRYYTSDLVLVVAADGPYADATSLADFKDATVTAQLGTLHYDVIDQIDGVKKADPMQDFNAMIAALTSGRIDAYVSERPGAISAQISNPSLSYVSFEGDAGFDYETGDVSISIGVRQSDEDLRQALNYALAQISDDERQAFMEGALRNQPLVAE